MRYTGQARKVVGKYLDAPMRGFIRLAGARQVGINGQLSIVQPFDGNETFLVDPDVPFVTNVDDTEFESQAFIDEE